MHTNGAVVDAYPCDESSHPTGGAQGDGVGGNEPAAAVAAAAGASGAPGGGRGKKLRFATEGGGAGDESQPCQLGTEDARLQASEPGRALAERLRKVTVAPGGSDPMKLAEIRGGTGTLREGTLDETTDDFSDVACCCLRQPRRGFYVVKGPWMLRFRKDDPNARMIGVPIPLDGAEVAPVGSNEFEIHNIHIKKDFYGKEELKKVRGFRQRAFEHVILRRFSVQQEERRDEWVRVLQAQVEKLRDTLAWKLERRAAHGVIDRSTNTSIDTKGSTAAVGRLAAALFAEWEEDVERKELGLAGGAMSGRVLQ